MLHVTLAGDNWYMLCFQTIQNIVHIQRDSFGDFSAPEWVADKVTSEDVSMKLMEGWHGCHRVLDHPQ